MKLLIFNAYIRCTSNWFDCLFLNGHTTKYLPLYYLYVQWIHLRLCFLPHRHKHKTEKTPLFCKLNAMGWYATDNNAEREWCITHREEKLHDSLCIAFVRLFLLWKAFVRLFYVSHLFSLAWNEQILNIFLSLTSFQ